MDTLPNLRGEDPNKSLYRHDLTELPALLSQMQKGNADRRNTIENDVEQRARRMTQSQLPDKHGGAGSLHCMELLQISFAGVPQGEQERPNGRDQRGSFVLGAVRDFTAQLVKLRTLPLFIGIEKHFKVEL